MKTRLLTILILFSGFCFAQKSHTIIVSENSQKTELTKLDGIEPFYFSDNSTDYKNENYIESIVNALKIYGTKKIEIVGHCSSNEFKKNQNIAIQRAEFIKSVLIKLGIPEHQILTKTEKDRIPLDMNNPESEQNKRVELWIM
ncbi:OmpA family protein [Aquimarina sp. 433]